MASSNQIEREEASKQVLVMAKRTAMLYKSFAEVLQEELGEQKAKEVILKAINKYGYMCGKRIAEGVEDMGLDLSISNYFKIPDLPELGWDIESSMIETDKKLEAVVHYCPLAEYWLENMDSKIARLYCYVDQAKFSAYNPNIKCTHAKNFLDGDEVCKLIIEKENASDKES